MLHDPRTHRDDSSLQHDGLSSVPPRALPLWKRGLDIAILLLLLPMPASRARG